MFRSQPELKVGQRTIPVKHLDENGKEETGEMNDLDGLMPGTPNGPKEEKNDPKKVDDDDKIRQNLVKHSLPNLMVLEILKQAPGSIP